LSYEAGGRCNRSAKLATVAVPCQDCRVSMDDVEINAYLIH